MAFSPKDALTAAREVMAARRAEAPRLDFISGALNPKPFRPELIVSSSASMGTYDTYGLPTVELPKNATPVQQRLAWKARTNFLPLVLDTFSQTMKVDGYISPQPFSEEHGNPWEYLWQPNGLAARQTGVHRSALAYGASYVTCLPGDRAPVVRGVSPRKMTAVYSDPAEDDYPLMALRIDDNMIRLYDEEMVYFIGAEKAVPRTTFGAATKLAVDGQAWTFIEARPHEMGVTPVVRFRDKMLLEGDEQFGIIEPLIDVQRRIDETTFGLMIAQYYAAFKQRYIIGWVPDDEEERMRATASEFWTFEDEDVRVGQFDETDLNRYIASKESALGDMAAIGQVPAQNLGAGGISNISAETLAALESGKERKSGEITTSFGESWANVFRLGGRLVGDAVTADDTGSQVRWKNTTARSLGQVTDAMVKWVSSLDVPSEIARQWLPGWTDELERQVQDAPPRADKVAEMFAAFDRQARAEESDA